MNSEMIDKVYYDQLIKLDNWEKRNLLLWLLSDRDNPLQKNINTNQFNGLAMEFFRPILHWTEEKLLNKKLLTEELPKLQPENWSSRDSFFLGIKPACFEVSDKLSTDQLQYLESYPYFEFEDDKRVYFQDESSRDLFIINCPVIESPEWQFHLGMALGFPPKAVVFYQEHYKRMLIDEEKERMYFHSNKVGIWYAGIMFTSFIGDLAENIPWLWNTYKVPATITVLAKLWEEDRIKEYSIHYQQYGEIEKAFIFMKEVLNRNREWFNTQSNDQTK